MDLQDEFCNRHLDPLDVNCRLLRDLHERGPRQSSSIAKECQQDLKSQTISNGDLAHVTSHSADKIAAQSAAFKEEQTLRQHYRLRFLTSISS